MSTSIWHRTPDIALMNGDMNKGTIGEHLDIKMIEVGDDFLRGTMPADHRTFQPYKVVHGGANVVLAESLGSIAGAHVIDMAKFKCLGQEVSASQQQLPSKNWLVVNSEAAAVEEGWACWIEPKYHNE